MIYPAMAAIVLGLSHWSRSRRYSRRGAALIAVGVLIAVVPHCDVTIIHN